MGNREWESKARREPDGLGKLMQARHYALFDDSRFPIPDSRLHLKLSLFLA